MEVQSCSYPIKPLDKSLLVRSVALLYHVRSVRAILINYRKTGVRDGGSPNREPKGLLRGGLTAHSMVLAIPACDCGKLGAPSELHSAAFAGEPR